MRETCRLAMLVALGLLLGCCAAPERSPPPMPREMHGSSEAFAAPGVRLVWGVVRGTDEASTVAVMRIATDRTVYPWLAVTGRDPFTQAARQVMPASPSAGVQEMRLPRTHFAEFPRTELRFYRSAADAHAGRPALVVFFLGVPDTTPEFASTDGLRTYLEERERRTREIHPMGTTTPGDIP